MKRVKQIVMMAFASLLAQCVWAATVTITNTDKDLTGDAVANWQFSGITVPAVDGQLAVGDIVKVTSISLGCRDENAGHPTAAIKIGDALSSSRELSSDNWLSVPVAKKVTYTFDNLYLKVGTSATMTSCDANGTAGNFRMALYNCEAAREQRVVTSSNFTASNNYTLPYEVVVEKVVDVSFDTTIDGAKPTTAKAEILSNHLALATSTDYDQTVGEKSAEVMQICGATLNTCNVFGGWNTGATGGTLSKDVWINAVGGLTHTIVGGSWNNWNGSKKSFEGNVVIEVGNAAKVDNIVGADYQDWNSPTSTGDINIVVKDDAIVNGGIIGGSVCSHSRTITLTGNTLVTIKNIQSYNTSGGTKIQNDNTDYTGYIVGGGAYGWNAGGTSKVDGNTAVVVALDESASGTFVKNLVGGGFMPAGGGARGSGTPNIQVTGNSSVTISAPSTVKFTGTIVAGGYKASNENGNTPVDGTATLTLNGGDFSEATLLAGTATGNKILNVNMDMTLDAATIASSGFTHVNIGAGKKLTVNVTDETTLTTIFGGEGALVKAGAGALTLNANNTLTGGIEVSAGTLKTSSSKGFGPYNETSDLDNMSIIKVAEDAVLDVANVAGSGYGWCYKVELAGELTNSGSAMGTSSRQLAAIKVTGDKAKITGVNDYCLLNSGYESTKLDLNDHTLEVAMSEGKQFHLRTTAITGTGTIKVTSGTLHNTTGTNLATGADVTVIVKAGATFDDGVYAVEESKIKPINADYVINKNGCIYTAVARPAGTVYATQGFGSYKLDADTVVTLVDGDTIVCNRSYMGSNNWGGGKDLTELANKNHKIIIEHEMDLGGGKGIPAGIAVTVNYKDTNTAGDPTGVYLYGDIAAGSTIDGTGRIFLGHKSGSNDGNASIGAGTTISCEVAFQKSNTATINGAVAFSGTVSMGDNNRIILNDGATLTVSGDLDISKVTTTVTGKHVVKNGNVFSLALDTIAITIPAAPEHMTVAVTDEDGETIAIAQDGTIAVVPGSTFKVTYTPETGYCGDPISTTYTNASTETQVVAPAEPPVQAVAKIGTTLYPTLAAAFAVGGDVTLLQDTIETLTVAAGKTVTLDINGKVVKSQANTITVKGTLIVNNTAVNGAIRSVTSGKSAITTSGSGTFTINGGTIDAVGTAVSGAGTITGGTITSSGSFAVYANSSSGSIEITGGTITGATGDVGIYTGNVKVTGVTLANGIKFASNAYGLVLAGTDTALIPAEADVEVYNGETLEGYYFSASSNGLYTTTVGKVCKLVKDITHQVIIYASTTLDLNGHDITVTDKDTAILVKAGSSASKIRTATIIGEGTVSCDNGAACNAVRVERYADLTIAGGTYVVATDKTDPVNPDNATIYIINSYKTAPTKVTITGGTFEAKGSGKYTLNILDSLMTAEAIPTITVSGGTFVKFDPAGNNDATVADGYISIAEGANYVVAQKGAAVDPTPTTDGVAITIPVGGATVEVDGAVKSTIPNTTGKHTVVIKDSTGKVIRADEVGVVNVEKTTVSTTHAVAVPFKGKTVATLLNTALLAEDDTLMAWIGGKYETWKLDADKNWVAQTTHAQSGNHTAPAPAEAALKCGQAVWVTTAGQIVTFGDVNATGDTVELEEGHNLLGNTSLEDATPTVAATADQVQLIGEVDAEGNEIITRYNKTSTGWQSKIQKRTYIEAVKKWVTTEETSNEAPTVKPGRGYWLIRK